LTQDFAVTDQPFLSFDALLATTEHAVRDLLGRKTEYDVPGLVDSQEDQTIRRHLAFGVVLLFRQIGVLNVGSVADRRFSEEAARLEGEISAARDTRE
jgi:hypothetical protein